MISKTSQTLRFLAVIGLAYYKYLAVADAFLKITSSRHRLISEEEVQRSLLEEVEGTFGDGAASSRLKRLEAILKPMYVALPKNENGYLERATVRYALHRLFVQHHGWIIKGLHDEGAHRNVTSAVGLFKEQVPAYVQDLFEKRLGGRGFGLHELGVLAATIEHLVHNEVVTNVADAFKVHGYLPTSTMKASQVDEVLDTYMMGYILHEPLDNMSREEAMEIKAEMPETFNAWSATQQFVHELRLNITLSESSSEQKQSGEYDFSLVARVAERVGEKYGRFQDHECRRIKALLHELEEGGTGRVRLSDFWKPSADNSWHFEDSYSYLKQLGALDETDTHNPRVLIANYITSPSNCIASSSFYSVCCMDECESLLGQLEEQIAAPDATPSRIASLVALLSFGSVAAPRVLSDSLVSRLDEIAVGHGGKVPLHGRLFAQWMHHVFPRECPYPHLAGTTRPLTPDEWLEETGEEERATLEEKNAFFDTLNATELEPLKMESLPWSPEEELLVTHKLETIEGHGFISSIRQALMFAVVVAVTFRLALTSSLPQHSDASKHLDKTMV